MIRTVAGLLDSLKQREMEIDFEIWHPTCPNDRSAIRRPYQ